MTPTLEILRGVSGSGKSTYARARAATGAVVVSRDDLRVAFFGSDGPDYYTVPKDVLRSREDYISTVEQAAIKGALLSGKDVVSDNTHTMMKYVNRVAKIGYSVGANVEMKVFDIPLREAVARVEARANFGGRDVPVDAIKRQHDQLAGSKNATLVRPPEVKPYHGTPGEPKAFLVDIDGTLAHMRDLRGPFDWAKVGVDEPDEVVIEILDLLMWYTEPYNIIVMSGRDESCRAETEAWLVKHGITFDELFMRPEKDMRADNIVKAELFDKYVRDNYDVRFVLDDRDQVVEMWRSMGIKCLQVAPGDF